jgi:hypothetical protein
VYYAWEFAPLSAQMWCIFPREGYIFLILQHFATKLCKFTKFNTLFLAVVMDFALLAYIKI